QVKPNGQSGAEELTGVLGNIKTLRNPLFEINKRDIAPGTIVELIPYPVTLIDPSSYLRQRPEATVREVLAGDGASTYEQQEVKWNGAIGGTYKLKITNSAGTEGTSSAINYDDDGATIRMKLNASGVVSVTSVGGNGLDATITFLDNFSHLPLV